MIELSDDLKSAAAFYAYLGVGAGERRFLERYAGYRYAAVAIPKRRGGTRTLLVPDRRLRFLQRKTLELLEPLHTPRKPVHGFIKGRGAISNASAHQTRPYLLNLDLENYFGSIAGRRIFGLLRALGFEQEVAHAVCTICIARNQLPQGAPTSPLLANMVSYRLDRDLMNFAKTHRMRYTRYADDISLSSYVQPVAAFQNGLPAAGRVAIDQLSKDIRSIISSNGFDINTEKIWFAGPRSRKEVTGLVVNEFTNVERRFIRNLRASLYKIETMGPDFAQRDYESRYNNTTPLEKILRGRLEWIAQVRGRSFGSYRTLAKRFNQQYPRSSLPIDPTYEEIAERAVWVIEFFEGEDCDQGTAFFLKDVGFVTADHVLEKLLPGRHAVVYRPTDPSRRFQAKPSNRRCQHRDLVILDHNVPDDAYLAFHARTSPEHPDDNIIVLGYPAFGPGDGLGKRRGHIVGRATKNGVKLIEVSVILEGGISGGPIVNERYEVLGVARRGGNSEPKQFAVEVAELLRLAVE